MQAEMLVQDHQRSALDPKEIPWKARFPETFLTADVFALAR